MPLTATLFIPALNEIVGMKTVMPRIRREWFDQILVCDGQSTDGTAEFARAQGYEVVVQRKPGLRHAYIEGFPRIRGDIVVTFSPDGNCIPELVPALLARMREGYDMVIVSRYAGSARSEDDDLMTGFGNWMFTRTINLCHGGRYTDALGMYRAYRTKLFYELDMDRDDAYVTERLFGTVIGVEVLLSVRAAKRRLRVADIPGDEPARVGGQRKLLPFRWGGGLLLQVFRETYFWR